MTRKHFIALADALRSVKPSGFNDKQAQWYSCAEAVAEACQLSNPDFDRARWWAYLKSGSTGGA